MLREVKRVLAFPKFLGLIPVALESYYQTKYKDVSPNFGTV